jgi:hypothetical protein
LLIPRLNHGATKGIQITEKEKVTALVRGVENGAETAGVCKDRNAKSVTTMDTKEYERRRRPQSMQDLATLGLDFTSKGWCNAGFDDFFVGKY